MGLTSVFERLPAAVPRGAAERVAALPPYQVALWPDGWEPLGGGALMVRDTDAMAEARRWYRLADRNGAALPMERAMRLHGTFVPRSIVALSGRHFPSGEAASVAVQLVAGDWVRRRRVQLAAEPGRALLERDLAWSGSRSGEPRDQRTLAEDLARLLAECAAERLIPSLRCAVRVERDEGFGVGGYRCVVETALDPYARRRLAETLATAVIPWNRGIVREGRAHPLIAIQVRGPEPKMRINPRLARVIAVIEESQLGRTPE